MADTKISALTSLPASGFADDDVFAIVDTSATETKKTSVADLDERFAGSGHVHTSGDVSDFGEAAQDAIGSILLDSSRIDFTYNDVTPSITADLIAGSVTDTYVASGIDATKIGSGVVSNTEFAFLDGVSSAIQTQLDGKAATSHTQAASTITDFDEAAQDAIGTILVDSSTIDFTYADATPSITAIVKAGSIGDTELASGLDVSQFALADGNIIVGSAAGAASSVNPSGDIDVSNTGVFSINSGVIVNADINASAAIDFSKLAALSSANILVGSSGNVATSVAMSGDTTISNAGVVTIGAQKVDVSKMTSAANSFAANNTGSTAAPTAQTYNKKDAATYSGSISWTGTTAPSGSTTHEYGFIHIGNKVEYWIILKYSVAGSALSQVAMEFPGDFPAMREPAGQTAGGDKLWSANGFIDAASSGSPGVGRSWIRRNAGDSAYEVVVQTGSGTSNALMVWVQGMYFTA